MNAVTLDSLDLAALLCSRVCHDVISPVGAIVNGLEVLEDENDASMRDFALDLIRKSARQASARLQFARLAFGAAGSAGASIDLGDAEQVARGMFQDDKVTLSWSAPRALLPKNRVKLLLNLLVIATNAVPRGGTIDVKVTGDAEASEFVLT
jgi:histidine phosphotransferase ChpT